jgi:DNA-directed RNA polymerase specialized sigma24 family protein
MEPTRTHRFEELFRAHYPAVRGYALRRTSPETA